jgi:hypothetical protein
MCPPATKRCPLGRKAKPAQKMFAPTCVPAVFLFVDGSQSVGLSPAPNGGQYSTLPVGRTLAWTAWYGQVITDENCPTVAGFWALADETAISCVTPNPPSATNPTFDQSEEHEQNFSRRCRTSNCRPITKPRMIICNFGVNTFFTNPLFFNHTQLHRRSVDRFR